MPFEVNHFVNDTFFVSYENPVMRGGGFSPQKSEPDSFVARIQKIARQVFSFAFAVEEKIYETSFLRFPYMTLFFYSSKTATAAIIAREGIRIGGNLFLQDYSPVKALFSNARGEFVLEERLKEYVGAFIFRILFDRPVRNFLERPLLPP